MAVSKFTSHNSRRIIRCIYSESHPQVNMRHHKIGTHCTKALYQLIQVKMGQS